MFAPEIATIACPSRWRRRTQRASRPQCPAAGLWRRDSLNEGADLNPHRETDLERHLIVRDLAVLYMAPRLHDLEPSQMSNGLVGTADRSADGILDAGLGRAHELYDFVDMVLHGGLLAL